MHRPATSILENIIRQELSLLREQDDKEIKKLKQQIKKLKQGFEDATHQEQEDRITNKIKAIDQQIKDIESSDKDSDQTPDASWLGRPVPPPDQYNGKNGNKSKVDLYDNDYFTKSGTINVELSKEAAFSFYRLYHKMPKEVQKDITKIFSFRTYKSQYNLIDWDHWKKNKEYKTISQNGKVFPAAEPGASSHGVGNAIDIYPSGLQAWMKAKAKYYGWYQNVKNDKPHFQYFPGKDLSSAAK